MIRIPIKVASYLIKKNPANIEWSHPFVQDNLELVYNIVKEIVKPY